MRTRSPMILSALLSVLPAYGDGTAPSAPQASIVRIELAARESESRPYTVPTEPEDTLEIDFPWPVEDWAGRGFTPDPDKYAGDFVVEATRGRPRLFVTPVTGAAHRVLHVVLAAPDGQTRSIPIELIPAPAGYAWHTVVFVEPSPPKPDRGKVSLAPRPPKAAHREPSTESEIGLIRTLRLMVDSTAADALSVASANPALELAVATQKPRSFGDYTITSRYALRDSSTGSLGLCVSVANETSRRLLFEPGGWVIRAGDRIYPVQTIDFPEELEPGASAAAFLVLTDANGLLPDNAFEVSAVLAGSVNPRPVSRIALAGLEQ